MNTKLLKLQFFHLEKSRVKRSLTTSSYKDEYTTLKASPFITQRLHLEKKNENVLFKVINVISTKVILLLSNTMVFTTSLQESP